MSKDRDAHAARRSWIKHSLQIAHSLERGSQLMQEAFAGELSLSDDHLVHLVETWIHQCTEIGAWLESTPAPEALKDAESELHAYLGVSRTVSALFRSLSDASGEQRLSRTESLRSSLQRSEDHLHSFEKLLKD